MITHAMANWIRDWISCAEGPLRKSKEPTSRIHRWIHTIGHAAGAAAFIASFGALALPAMAGWGLVEAIVLFGTGLFCSSMFHGIGDLFDKCVATIHYLSLPLRGTSWKEWSEKQNYGAVINRVEEADA